MSSNYLLQLLQNSGQTGQPQDAPDPSQFQSVQGEQPPSAPAYSDMADLQSQQPPVQRVTQPPPSKLKQMLMGMMHGMGEAARIDAGMGNDSDNAYKSAQTEHTKALTQQMGEMTDTPFGPMPKALAMKILPVMLGAQSRERVAGMNNDSHEAIAQNALDSRESMANNKPTSATGKVDPIIYSQIGPPPDPTTNPAGAKAWGKMAEAIKTRMATDPKVAGYKALVYGRAAVTPFSTVDGEGNPTTISNLDAIKQGAMGINKQNLGSTMGKAALIGDIKGGVEQVRDFTKVFDSATSRKQIAAVLAQPGMTSQTFFQSPIAGSMDEDTQSAVIQLLNLKENAMAMRSVLGAGQGSEDLRRAIQQTIPGAVTPSKAFADKQLDTFLATLGRLEKGIPNMGAATKRALGQDAGGGKAIEQYSASRKSYRYSVDGGKTWQDGRAPSK